MTTLNLPATAIFSTASGCDGCHRRRDRASIDAGGDRRGQTLLSRQAFAPRVARHFAAASPLIGVSLLVGMAGYHWLEGMAWIDAFANAAMILSGMGPLAPMQTWGGKLFAPLLHRQLHSIHVETDEHG
jgi:hypothetical protein